MDHSPSLGWVPPFAVPFAVALALGAMSPACGPADGGAAIDRVEAARTPLCCASCCYIEKVCRLAGDIDPQDPCSVCDPEGPGGALGWSDRTGTCDDGDPCSDSDVCTVGVCAGVPLAAGDPCDDGDPCTNNESCNGSGACVGTPIDCSSLDGPCQTGACDPGDGTCVPSPRAAGTDCASIGPSCAGFVCDGASRCTDPAESRCATANDCVLADTANPQNPCEVCRPEIDSSGWTPVADATGCGAAQTCSSGATAPVLIPADLCDAGICVTGVATDCGTYARCAANGIDCISGCVDDTDCVSDAYCGAGTCIGQRADGLPCTIDVQCASGSCVDGVCCAEACDGLCVACVAGVTGETSGVCAPVRAGIDPHNDCDPAPQTCGAEGGCDGSGACALYADGTPCATASCTPMNQLITHACDGKGACGDNEPGDCGPGICAVSRCQLACSAADECAPGAWCDTDGHACTYANRPPVAQLDGPTEALSNVPLTLDASASTDPDGDKLTFSFAQLLGPTAELHPDGAHLGVTFESIAATDDAVFEVVADDGTLASEPAIHVVAVRLVGAGCPCTGGKPSAALALLGLAALVRSRWQRRRRPPSTPASHAAAIARPTCKPRL